MTSPPKGDITLHIFFFKCKRCDEGGVKILEIEVMSFIKKEEILNA